LLPNRKYSTSAGKSCDLLKRGGDLDKANEWRDRVLTEKPDLTSDSFFLAFPYSDPAGRERIKHLFAEIGL